MCNTYVSDRLKFKSSHYTPPPSHNEELRYTVNTFNIVHSTALFCDISKKILQWRIFLSQGGGGGLKRTGRDFQAHV